MSNSSVRVTFEIPLSEFGSEEIQKRLRDSAKPQDLIAQAVALLRDSVVAHNGEDLSEIVSFAKSAEILTVLQ